MMGMGKKEFMTRMANKSIKEKGFYDQLFHLTAMLVFTIFAFLCIYPFWYVLIYSMSDPKLVGKGLSLLPVGFTLQNYQVVFGFSTIYSAFLVSTLRAVIGTLVTLFFSSMFAYVLTKNELRGRKFIYRMMVVTMYIGAGLIPWYLTMRFYGLKDNFLLYILPSAVAPYYVILIKTYIEQIPSSIEESAVIDGANYFQIFTHMIIPLSTPVLAAVGVFSAVGQWNSWTDNFYLVRNPNLQTLQLVLLDILKQSESIARALQREHNYQMVKNVTVSPMAIRMTITIVTIIPILLVYPFLQKFFIKGIMLGAVKG
jgi:putative aldouronate transport system permease protein